MDAYVNRGKCYNTQIMRVFDIGRRSRFAGVLIALGISNLVSMLLYVVRALDADNLRYWFLLWNLALGWLPLLIVWWLTRRLKHSSWLSIPNIVLTFIWLGFLPNSFYVLSDLVHLHATGEVGLLYDAVLFFSVIFNGFSIGFISLVMIHRALLARVRRRDAHILVAGVLLACSFAIYLGRYLRWNTWDVLVNPAGVLFDVSDRVVNPAAHPQAFVTTMTFFILLSSTYGVVWQLITALSAKPR